MQVGVFLSRLVDWGQRSCQNAWRHAPTCVGWAATPPATDAGPAADHAAADGSAGSMPHAASAGSMSAGNDSWRDQLRFAGRAAADAADLDGSAPPPLQASVLRGSGQECLSAVSSDCSTDMETTHGGKGVWLGGSGCGERV